MFGQGGSGTAVGSSDITCGGRNGGKLNCYCNVDAFADMIFLGFAYVFFFQWSSGAPKLNNTTVQGGEINVCAFGCLSRVLETKGKMGRLGGGELKNANRA